MGFLFTQYYNFRNLANTRLPLEAPQVVLVGENGQGKTNFIESVYLLCFGSSFRSKRMGQLVNHRRSSAAVSGAYSDGELHQDRGIKIDRGSKKEIRVDGKLVRDRKELIETIPCIVFSHQDMEIVIGPPERRRRFFNQTLSLFEPFFIDLLRRYRQILKSRNLLLRQGNTSLLEAYDRHLIEVGLQIQSRRRQIVTEFNETFVPIFRDISQSEEPVKIRYQPSWKEGISPEEVLSFLKTRIQRDLRFETTTTGPHRDRFLILQGHQTFAYSASTGQIRLGALILKVAQARFFSLKSGRKPILLLDDVLLELDRQRRNRFIDFLPSYEQAFFTFLPEESFQRYIGADNLIYTVRGGVFSPGRGR